MKPETTLVLDDRDLRMAEMLVQLGLSLNEAKVLVYLDQVDEAVSRQVEQGADMRQPEVSKAMRSLRRRGWVAKRDINREGKGRPLHCYRLDVPMTKVMDALEDDVRRRAKRDLGRLDRLREMIAGDPAT